MAKAELAMARGDPGLSNVAFLCGDEALLPKLSRWVYGLFGVTDGPCAGAPAWVNPSGVRHGLPRRKDVACGPGFSFGWVYC